MRTLHARDAISMIGRIDHAIEACVPPAGADHDTRVQILTAQSWMQSVRDDLLRIVVADVPVETVPVLALAE